MRSEQKVSEPVAGELFTTAFSHVTPAAATVCPSPALNYSPAPQVLGQNGDLIEPTTAESLAFSEIEPGIIHHAACQAGEKVGPLRRGGLSPFAPRKDVLSRSERRQTGKRTRYRTFFTGQTESVVNKSRVRVTMLVRQVVMQQ